MRQIFLVFVVASCAVVVQGSFRGLEARQQQPPPIVPPITFPTTTGPTGTATGTATGTGTNIGTDATDTGTTDTSTTTTTSSSSTTTTSTTSSSTSTTTSPASSLPPATETQPSTVFTTVTSDTASSSSSSDTAAPTPTNKGSSDGSDVNKGTIIGLSVAGGIAVLGVIAFIVWKLTRKRFSEFDANGEEIKWPELNNEAHVLPTRTTGRAGIDDDGDDQYGNTPRDPSVYGAASTVTGTSVADLSNYNDPYAVPPLPHLNPNQPYRDDPSQSSSYYDPYRGPVPQSLHDPTNPRDGAESIPMSAYSNTTSSGYGSSQTGNTDYNRVRSPVDGRTSPGPNMAYGGRTSPGPNAAYGGRTSPGPNVVYGGQRSYSPGPAMAYPGAARSQSPGPAAAYGSGRQSPGLSNAYRP